MAAVELPRLPSLLPLLLLLLGWELRVVQSQCAPPGNNAIVVDAGGRGDFTSVQAAVDSLPVNNRQWVIIKINPGYYREKVTIPPGKQCIAMRGSGQGNTVIAWNDGSSPEASTFTALADNFVAAHIMFKNEFNVRVAPRDGKITQAVAVKVSGDKAAFYDCTFKSYQDTLWDALGRHYFKQCHIIGAIDFIWGQGQSIYEDCNLELYQNLIGGVPGFITAQGRDSNTSTSGFVFKFGSITGSSMALLGRAWRPYSRVVFYKFNMANVILPKGWDAWHNVGHEDLITYAEEDCSGPGSNKSQRVPWEKHLPPRELSALIDITFIDKEGWLKQQPVL